MYDDFCLILSQVTQKNINIYHKYMVITLINHT